MKEFLSEVHGAPFEALVAGSLAEAVGAVAGCDVVLLDLSLPDAQGTSVITRMADAAGRIPIIVLTGNTDETVALRAMSFGADDYLLKSEVTPSLIGRAVFYAIERRANAEQERRMMALEIARSESERVAVRARFLGDISAALAANLTVEAIVDTVVRFVTSALADSCTIHLSGEHADGAPPALPANGGAALPLVARDRVLGELRVGFSPDRTLTNESSLLLEEIARRAAIAIDNASLYLATQRALRAREEMLAIVSHDLRNPLSVIALVLQVARQEAELSRHPNPDSIRRGLRAIAAMERLIEDLLDVARIDAGTLVLNKGPIDVASIVRDIVELNAPLAAEKAISLEPQLDAMTIVEGDRHRLVQVITNLLGNAIKFTPKQGAIVVRCQRLDDEVRVSVQDSGPGIEPENLPHVFDRFYQSDRRRGGAGLGLAIAKGIVDQHEGRIGVESTLGKGSDFWFTLPAANRST